MCVNIYTYIHIYACVQIYAHIFWIDYIWPRSLFQVSFRDSAGEKFAFFLQKKNFPVLKLTQVLLQSNKYPYNISKAVRAGNAAVLEGFA